MRIHLKITPNVEIVPYNYQELLTRVLHKWIGVNNSIHDDISLYSFSWLTKGTGVKDGIQFKNGAGWFISFHDDTILNKIIENIQNNPYLFNGMSVVEITLQPVPKFGNVHKFDVGSPVLIKKKNIGDKNATFHYFDEPESDIFLTNIFINKLKTAGINHENVEVSFDRSYIKASKKRMTYKGLKNIGSICNVIVKGSPEQIAFAWNVGLGSSTGIGFGSLI